MTATKSRSFNFSIHSVVRGVVRGPRLLVTPVARELASFADRSAGAEPDLEVDLNYLGFSGKKPGEIPGGLAFAGSHLIGRWQVVMSDPDRPPLRLHFRGNLASRFIVSKWIVEPAIRVAAQRKGALMVHAAALSDGEHAVLVAGSGGAGKTTWVLKWLEAGHPFLSDDFSFIMAPRVLPYVTPMRLGLRNLMVNPVLHRMSLLDKMEATVRTGLRQASLGRAKFYFKALPQRVIPGVKPSKPVEIVGAIYLDLNGKSNGCPMAMDPAELASITARVDREEMHGFGEGKLGDFWSRHENLIAQTLHGKPCHRLHPHTFPPPVALASIGELLKWASKP